MLQKYLVENYLTQVQADIVQKIAKTSYHFTLVSHNL